VQLSDRFDENNRSGELKTIAADHRTSTWREAIDFDQPITTERKILAEIPFIFVSGGRLTTIHAAKPQQVTEIIDRHQSRARLAVAVVVVSITKRFNLGGNLNFHRKSASAKSLDRRCRYNR
jgi:hypothetical protein